MKFFNHCLLLGLLLIAPTKPPIPNPREYVSTIVQPAWSVTVLTTRSVEAMKRYLALQLWCSADKPACRAGTPGNLPRVQLHEYG